MGLMLVSNSYSAIMTINDRNAWEILLTEETTIDFEGMINSEYMLYPGNPQNVLFTSNQPIMLVDETFDDGAGLITLGTGDVIFGYYSGGGITASNFSGNAVGMNLRGYTEPMTTFNLILSSGEVATTTVNNPQGGFLGIISDDLITSVQIVPSSITSEHMIVDNFSFGTAATATVPEPGIFTLMTCSIIVFSFVKRKKVN
jgi:hypothetical protein